LLGGEKCIRNAYVDFGGGLRIKKWLDSVPQQPKSWTSINDEHTI